jgi:hypothetical protein
MLYCFDTSAINKLNDDPDRDAIVAGLLCTNTVRVTAINVMEVCKTRDRSRLLSLLSLLNRLAQGTLPLEVPNTLLVELAKSHRTASNGVTVTIGAERIRLWHVIQKPDLLTDVDVQEIARWTQDFEQGFQEMHDNARKAIEGDPKYLRPRCGAEVLRLHCSFSDPVLRESIGPMYEAATGETLDTEGLSELLQTCPSWYVWWASWIYSMWRRAIQQTKYGKAWNPGSIDVWSSVYLPFCDVFITHDTNQRRAFRVANAFNNPRTKPKIRSYSDFRNRLIVG